MNTRSQALAKQDDEVAASQARAIAAREDQRRPKNALEAMAARLQVSSSGLKDTLLKTVFKDCKSDAEFIALTVVANQYNLDPLRREIYAFPAKGGGITPMIGYDGWIRIMNEHPQFDGIEFDHILDDKGKVTAVEGVIYRKDRTRPTKKMIYLDEFKVDTNPNWKNKPNHMLDVRCLCHTVRIALGVSAGIEGDEDRFGEVRQMEDADYSAAPVSLPSHDSETGEVLDQNPEPERDPQTGMTQVDEETARELDRQQEEGLSETDQADEAEVEPRTSARHGQRQSTIWSAKSTHAERSRN